MKIIGSLGIGAPVSLAWSEKFKPMAINLPTLAIGQAIRGLPRILGNLSGLILAILAKAASLNWAAAISGIWLLKSLRLPSEASRAGFSLPTGPTRNNFMVTSFKFQQQDWNLLYSNRGNPVPIF